MSATGFANTTQRIDKWLWFARLVKTRSLAQRLVADGHVRVNRTRLNKASQTVSAGDVISMLVHDRVRVVQVVGLGHRRGPAPEARTLYIDLKEPQVAGTAQPDDVPA
jgi:ribosome-associated heat shock protein Hsp15